MKLFGKKKEEKLSQLEIELEKATEVLMSTNWAEEDAQKLYDERLKRVERLKILIGEKETPKKENKIVPWIPVIATTIGAAISLIEIVYIGNKEEAGQMMGKAWNRIFRGRV